MEEKKTDKEKHPFVDPKLFLLLIGLLAVWLVFSAFVPPEFKPTPGETQILATFKAMSGEELILNRTINVATGTNAFDAMKKVAEVGSQDFGEMGMMVESIEGTAAGENEFWALYVDGEMAMTGINGITLEKDTLIEWKLEGIEAYSG